MRYNQFKKIYITLGVSYLTMYTCKRDQICPDNHKILANLWELDNYMLNFEVVTLQGALRRGKPGRGIANTGLAGAVLWVTKFNLII